MSFETLFAALSPLADNGLVELESYGEKEAYIMSTLSIEQEALIFNEFIGQVYIDDCPEYSIFRMDLDNKEMILVTDFKPDKEEYYYPINFQITEDNIVINALSIMTLYNFLKRTNNRYVFLPINYECEIKDSGHRAVLSFDKTANKVYLLEPNGKPNFFNNVIGNINHDIELFLEKYTDLMNNVVDSNYKYIKTSIWNQKQIVLNNTSNTKISRGDCMSISILLCHLLYNLEYEPYVLYNSINNLSDSECVLIIRSYSVGLINYLKNNKDNKNILYVENLYKMYTDMKDGLPNVNSITDFNKYLILMHKKDPDLYEDLTKIYNLVY